MMTIFKKRSIKYPWLISYATLLMIPVLISILVYLVSSNVLEGEISKANTSLLKQVQFEIDSRLKDIEKLAFEISINPSVKELAIMDSNLKEAQQFNNVMKDLSVFKITNPFLDNIYLFKTDSQNALSYNTFLPNGIFMDRLMGYEGTTEEQWKQILNNKQLNEFIPIIGKNASGEPYCRSIAIIKTLPSDAGKTSPIKLMILIDSSKMLESILKIQWLNGSNVLIMDENNQVLASTSANYPALKWDSRESSKNIYSAQGTDQLTISYTTSDITLWKYVFMIPTKVIKEKSVFTRNITIFGLLISLLLGGVFAYFFLRRNYNPILSLINGIVKYEGISIEKQQNEYDYIQHVFSNTVMQKEQTKLLVEKQKKLLKSNDLVRWFKGNMGDSDAIQELLSTYNIHFKTDSLMIMLLYIEEKGALFNDLEQFTPHRVKERRTLARLIVFNIVGEFAAQNNYIVATEIDDMIAFIINFQEVELSNPKDEIIRIVNESKAIIEAKYQFSFKTSVSELKNDLQKIPEAYKEALDAMEYNIILGINEVTYYDMINSGTEQASGLEYFYSLRVERQLINFVKVGDLNRSLEILDELFEQNFITIPLSIPAAKLLMLNLLSTMIKTLYEISLYCDDAFLGKLNPINRLLSCQQIVNIKVEMRDMIEQVCLYIQGTYKDEDHKLVDTITSFIDEHYCDINLNISMIGEQLDMTPAYMSRLFKERTGDGLLDYINKIRMEKAKVLLNENMHSIQEIALKVGFVNSNTFIRSFKKAEGITPGSYKKMPSLSEDI